MLTVVLSALAFAAAYLIGAIPFGFLTAKLLKGVDIRTMGSGNIGATNVGRVLGFRFFVLVFLLDMGKGLLPTLGFPWLVARATGQGSRSATLAVLVAVATILGHNFPVYLRFKGGKGVATSCGALCVLDPIAMLAAFLAFVTLLLVTRYVSMSSLLAGAVFVGVHFVQVRDPWARDQVVMSVLMIGLLVLLVIRHRKNLERIWAGTEPKVPLRRRPDAPPSGRAGLILVVALALVGVGIAVGVRISRPAEVDCGAFVLKTLKRIGTGHQRAERVVFADSGRVLAVTCPRYNRVLLYRVASRALGLIRDIPLEGRPVALWPAADRLYVLERPIADAHHLEPGWWETFDYSGRPVGSRFRVGFDPDDLALTRDGHWALVLLSGRAEGEANRPAPALVVVDLDGSRDAPRPVAELVFEGPDDDPDRLLLDTSECLAAVSLLGSQQVAWIDLTLPDQPRVLGRTPLGDPAARRPIGAASRNLALPGGPEVETVLASLPIADRGAARNGDCILRTRLDESCLEVVNTATQLPIGRLALHGPANLGTVRPTGVAYAPETDLLAIADRSGGIHLVAIEPKPEQLAIENTDATGSDRRRR